MEGASAWCHDAKDVGLIQKKKTWSRAGHIKQPTVLILLVQLSWINLQSLACDIENALNVIDFYWLPSSYSLIKHTVYIVMMSKGQYLI